MVSHSATPGKHLPTHHPHPGDVGKHRQSGGHRVMALAALAAVLGIFAAGAFLIRPKSDTASAAVTPEAFVNQMERASQGVVFDKNVYGGTIRVDRKGAVASVTVEGIPPNVCVSVGWKLVRKGLLSINGVTPLRVSAAKLSELCNQDDAAATLVWSPKVME